MEGWEVFVLHHLVTTESQSVDTLGKDDRTVECFEVIVLDSDTRLSFSTMEILLLVLQVRNFRIDGNHRFCKLEEVSQRVDELVFTDSHVTASTCLEPAIAVATKKDGCTRCMVESITFYHGLQRCAEQGTTSTVVADYIVCKVYFRTPFQVFDTEAFFGIDRCIQWIHEGNLEFLGSVDSFLIIRFDSCHFVLLVENLHSVGAYELNLVTLTSPIESVCLRMHVSAYYGLVVEALHNLQVSTMHVDGIVHHAFVQTVARDNLTLTAREVSSIGLCSEVTRIVLATEAYVELFEGDVLADLCQETHTFGIMDAYIFQAGILVHMHEDARSRTLVVTHGHLGTRNETGILPMRCMECTFVNLLGVVGRAPQVAGLIYHMAGLTVERDTGLRIVHPSFAIAFEVCILAHTCLSPWFDAEGHALVSAFHNFNLGDVRLCKVDAEILEHGVFRTYKRERKHASVENEVRSCPVEGKVLPVFQSQAHRFRVRLVVVRNVILLLHGSIYMEIITAFFEKQSHFLAFVGLLDGYQGFLHLGREVFFRIRHDAVIAHLHHFFIGTCTHQEAKHAYFKNYLFHEVVLDG